MRPSKHEPAIDRLVALSAETYGLDASDALVRELMTLRLALVGLQLWVDGSRAELPGFQRDLMMKALSLRE
jgi:hypothetical protein